MKIQLADLDLDLATALQQRQTLHASLLDGLDEGVLLYDPDGELRFFNRACLGLLGLSEGQLARREPLDPAWRLSREDGSPIEDPERTILAVMRSGRPMPTTTLALDLPQGDTVWLEVSARPLAGADADRPSGVVASLRDVSAGRRDRNQLGRQAAFRTGLISLVEASLQGGLDAMFYQRVLETAAEVIPGAQAGSLIVRNGDASYQFTAAVNFDLDTLKATYLLEHEIQRELDNPNPQLIYGFSNAMVEPKRADALYRAGPTERIVVTLSVPVVLDGLPIAFFNLDNFERRDAFDPEAIEMARLFANQVGALWRRFKLEQDLEAERANFEHLAFHDPLTGLPNRQLLRDRTERAISQTTRTNGLLAVLFLDLDDFKRLNDSLGHDTGDLLLEAVAERLTSVVREADTVARWGGDEFVVLLTNLARAEDASAVARKILDALNRPFEIAGREVRTGVSIGVDVYPYRAEGADDLVKHADIALYRAKAGGRNRVVFFSHEMNEELQERLGLEVDLRRALRERALTLHYQPRVELSTGCITSVEALVRWPHPEQGMISPARFIPLAEETGLILDLGSQVLDMACRQARAWQDVGLVQRVAINISTVQLAQGNMAIAIAAALERHHLEPARLEIEITESAAMRDVGASIATLKELEALGVTIALDDFGTAYSSLGYLTRLPLTSLKIDRSFIGALQDDPALTPIEAGIVQAVVALGHSLGYTLVGEGVETEAQRRFLERLGCQEAQGYLFARPLPAAEVSALLRRGKLQG